MIEGNYNYNEKILKTLRPIHLNTKPRVLLMSTLWICFVFVYRPIKAPFLSILDDPCSSMNFCLALIFPIYNFVCKQLSSMFLNSYRFQQHYGFS